MWLRCLKVTIIILEICYHFVRDGFFELKEDCLFDVAAKLIGVELLDVDLLELIDSLIHESAVKVEESWIGHLGVIRNGQAGVEVYISWFICQPGFGFAEEDPGPSSLGGSR